MKSVRIVAIVLFVLSVAPSALAQPPVNLGVNLDAQGAFVDVVKHTNRYSGATSFDANGWPQSDFSLVLFDGRPATEWTQTIDDPEVYRVDYSGRYLAHFTGSADVVATGTAVSVENMQYNAVSNISTFDLVVGAANSANHGLVFLQFSNTKALPAGAANSGITNLVVHRPGYDRFATQTFTDAYLALCKAADFTCYRYYNVQNIWSGEPTYPTVMQWSMRKTRASASQVPLASLQGRGEGWSWDIIVELANILKKDIWINIHMSCDSGYVTSLARMLQDSLDPSINIYVENSNEVWSPTQLTHGPYNAAASAARGITFDEQYAHRTVQLSQWFGMVFGANAVNKRIRVVLAGQHAYHGRSDNHLRYIDRVFGLPRNFIYATSTALYHGSTRADNPDPLQINEGMIEDITAQLTNTSLSTYRRNHTNKAKQWNLVGGCTSYEGGAHVPFGLNANLSAQISSHRTERMRDVVTYNYREGWQALDGGLAMYFTLVSGYNRYGCWGLTDDYTKPYRNYKMHAVQDLLAGPTDVADDANSGDANADDANSGDATANNNHSSTISAYIDRDKQTLNIAIDKSMIKQTQTVELFDMLGRRVYAADVSGSLTLTIPLPFIAEGLYVLKLGDSTSVVW
ncbi:MAG: hypothetical protein SGJ05_02800 [bacterium]|nr:hypothetical protein [bacterium]